VSHADKPADTRGPDTIEHEMEATRQRLAATIDLLAHRASPKTIARREVESIKAHFVTADGSPRTNNIIKVAGVVVGFVTLVVVVRKVAS
jgi:hypothetical protein